MKTSKESLFITFEGGEGSGKTTHIETLKTELQSCRVPVIATREPGGTPLGERIRESLLNPGLEIAISPTAELMLFLASRVQHLEEVILPAISEGKVILCDRFNDSSIAYQGGGRSLGVDQVQQLCRLACGNIEPDLTFFLDVDPKEGLKRLPHQPDRLEKETLAFHQRVRRTFLDIAKSHPKRVRVIDAGQSKEAVFAMILQEVDALLEKRVS